ncbi:PAS domain S-box-containing protein [Paracoccus tibetensis]|uniref:histidine kinase n=2 Tax=Paracoccus tibetensis TaxID=336292 RepID=A0A1G5K0G8_9RHOB|nr:PAS domain S-box-containing protein [Paracoccus tibetensis]
MTITLPASAGAFSAAELIQKHAWDNSPLGHLVSWPQALRTVVDLMLSSSFPMFTMWGRARTFLYNDAYTEILGDKHPAAWAKPMDAVWPEIWAAVGPMIEAALRGETIFHENLELILNRSGQAEPAWFTFSYSPLRTDDGSIAGVFCSAMETTAQIRAERALRGSEARLRFLDDLSAATGPLNDPDAVMATTTRMLGQHLNASVCAYASMNEDQDGFIIRGDWAAPGATSIVGQYRLADFGRAAVCNLTAGQPLVVTDNLRELAPEEAATFRNIGIAATICMPLTKEGRLTALMAIHDNRPRNWTAEDLGLMHEVTERSWAHIERVSAVADLRASEAALRRLNAELERQVVARTLARGTTWQITPDLMGALNPDGRLQAFNPAWAALLGWSESELAAMSIWEMLHPDDVERTRSSFALTLAGQPVFQFQNRYRGKDGRYHWLSWVGVPEDGLVYCTGRDVTEERARDAELAARTAERDRLWELSPDLLAAIDQSGRLLRINPSWSRVLGHDEEWLLTHSYADILHPEDAGDVAAHLTELKRTQRPVLLEHRLRAADGSWRSFVWTLSPEPGGERLYGVGRDVTAERAQARALAGRTAERDQLWTLSSDMLAHADYSGSMLAASPAWTRILGFSEAEVLTTPYKDLIHPEDWEQTSGDLAEMGVTGRPVQFRNRIMTKSGDYKHVEWTVVPDPGGASFIAIGRDLTEAKARERDLQQAQAALRQSQKLEALGQLTGGVAHDFNNLLTAVMSNLELLDKRVTGDERAQRLIQGAIQGAQRGATLTQRMLAFARRQELTVEAHDLGRLVERAEDLLRRSIGDGVELRFQIETALPLALVDDNQLDLALLNLALNARDAMPNGGVITVGVAQRVVGEPQAQGQTYVCLSVTDTGEGMDAETVDKAIQPFFTTKGVGKGSGLGLPMIHGLALQLNGRLHLTSQVGQGTTAELWLPALGPADAVAPTIVPPAPAPAQVEARPLHILMVDDDPLISMSTVDMLEDLGHDVTPAYSGAKALELLQSGPLFDLLITDFSMPKMNGRQLAEAARQLRPDLPILLATGYAELPEEDALRLPRLSKPYLQHELQAVIATALSHRWG